MRRLVARVPTRITIAVALFIIAATLLGLRSRFAATDTSTPDPTPTVSPDQVLVGAGNIASCDSSGDEATASLLDDIAGTVFTLGDNVYPSGFASEYTDCYEPSWGGQKSRTRPAPGNRDYWTSPAAGYYGYFGAAAGDPRKGYYSYDLGSWHVVVVNSSCTQVGGCGAGSPQEQWLRQDLATNTLPCTVSYWHHPLFTSGPVDPSPEMRPIFQALYDAKAEVVVSAHNHNYERFAPQDPNGNLDNARGIREFVAGTGGVSHFGFSTIQPNSEVRNADTFGVLKLTLGSTGYDWQFVPAAGGTFTDSGSGTCR